MDILIPKLADFPLTESGRYSKQRGDEEDSFAFPD